MKIRNIMIFLFLLVGLFLILVHNASITNSVVGTSKFPSTIESVGFFLILIATIIFVSEKTQIERELEDRLKKEPLHGEIDSRSYNLKDKSGKNIFFLQPLAAKDKDYQRLVKRLKHMDELELESTYDKKPIGIILNQKELNQIKEELLKKMPKELLNSDIDVYVHGSLSPVKGGKRTEKYGEKEPFLSDQFYVSDIDVAIVGKKSLSYIEEETNGESIRPDGKLKDKATLRFTLDKFLTKREKNYKFKKPTWIGDALRDLDSQKFAGRAHRPINIMFYKDETAFSKDKANLLHKHKK